MSSLPLPAKRLLFTYIKRSFGLLEILLHTLACAIWGYVMMLLK